MSLWGIDVGGKDDILVHICRKDGHWGHEYMEPFYKSNHWLMDYYSCIMKGSDNEKKRVIKNDYEVLQKIQTSTDPVGMHHNTKFHCIGRAFDLDFGYEKREWT